MKWGLKTDDWSTMLPMSDRDSGKLSHTDAVILLQFNARSPDALPKSDEFELVDRDKELQAKIAKLCSEYKSTATAARVTTLLQTYQ